jgi:hypothetical protein
MGVVCDQTVMEERTFLVNEEAELPYTFMEGFVDGNFLV